MKKIVAGVTAALISFGGATPAVAASNTPAVSTSWRPSGGYCPYYYYEQHYWGAYEYRIAERRQNGAVQYWRRSFYLGYWHSWSRQAWLPPGTCR